MPVPTRIASQRARRWWTSARAGRVVGRVGKAVDDEAIRYTKGPVNDAVARLQAKGFSFSVSGVVHGGEVVVGQTPAANTSVPLETTTVELTFGPPSAVGHP